MQEHLTKSGSKNAGRNPETEGDAKSRDDWETPATVVRALACLAYGPGIAFDLDAAASDENTKAPRWYTKKNDGISQRWNGRVFVNPPWSDIRRWLNKAILETEKSTCSAIVLGPLSDTTVRWALAHPLVPWRLIGNGRLSYLRAGKKMNGSTHATIAWFFSPKNSLAKSAGIISDPEISTLNQVWLNAYEARNR